MSKWKRAASLTLAGMMAVSAFPMAAMAEEEVPTFTIAIVRNASFSNDFLETEGTYITDAEKAAGVNIEWEIYTSADWAEKKALMLADNDLPDAFLGSNTLSSDEIVENKSLFVELSDLIDENMPNLKGIFEERPDLLYRAQDENGEIYSLIKEYPLRPKSLESWYINQTWLDNLGLEMPDTYEDLAVVLKAFYDEDANGNGDPTDEVPYCCNQSLGYDLYTLLLPFGTCAGRMGTYMALDGEGSPIFMPTQEKYKEAVKWAHELYVNGCLDPEAFTMDGSMVSSKRQSETAMVGIISTWDITGEVNAATLDQYVPMPALAGPDGERYLDSDQSNLDISNAEFMITTSCEDPAALLRFADALYTDESGLQSYFGSIPECLQKNEDGTYEVLAPADGTTGFDMWHYNNGIRSVGPLYVSQETQDKVILNVNGGDGKKLAVDSEYYAQYYKTESNCAMPYVRLNAEQIDTVTKLKTDIKDFCNAKYAHWVVDGGIDEEWDAYVEQLSAMGLDTYTGIYTDAYNAYLAEMQ